MAISVFPPAADFEQLQLNFALSSVNQNVYLRQTLPAGIYSFTEMTSDSYSFSFYDENDALLLVQNEIDATTSTTFDLPNQATKLFISSENAEFSMNVSIQPFGDSAERTRTFVDSSQQVTINATSRVYLIGGGGGGAGDSIGKFTGGGSGFFSTGILNAGTYTAVIGSGGASSSDGTGTSIGSLSAAGGTANGVGGSGSASEDGGGANGSGVKAAGFISGEAGISGNPNQNAPGGGGGVYAGGGNASNTNRGGGGGGGGFSGSGGGTNVGGTGGDGRILIVEEF